VGGNTHRLFFYYKEKFVGLACSEAISVAYRINGRELNTKFFNAK
jgi:hypothetical protein